MAAADRAARQAGVPALSAPLARVGRSVQLALLLLGWLALVLSSGFLALEASRADAEQALQRQAQQQSALLTRDLLQLHQHLLELAQQFADTPGEQIPAWQAGMVLQRFPALERVALLRDSEDGLLVTRGHAIETLARATHFVFDKTGTLTRGQMTLLETLPLGDL